MKYTKAERLKIGGKIYRGELTRYEAAEQYDIHPATAREYMRLYRDTNNLPPKGGKSKIKIDFQNIGSDTLEDYESMTKEQLIKELIKSKIAEARLKKGYEVKGVGANKEYILYDNKNTKSY